MGKVIKRNKTEDPAQHSGQQDHSQTVVLLKHFIALNKNKIRWGKPGREEHKIKGLVNIKLLVIRSCYLTRVHISVSRFM